MTRSELEKFLGKKVNVVIFDNDSATGILYKTRDEYFKYDANLYFPTNYYFVVDENGENSFLFRCSHIKKIKEVD